MSASVYVAVFACVSVCEFLVCVVLFVCTGVGNVSVCTPDV